MGGSILPTSNLLLIISDGAVPPALWQLLQKPTAVNLACATIGLVEEGALDAAAIKELRTMAEVGHGAWDLANSQEIGDAVYAMGTHLYRRYADVERCTVLVIDYGQLALYRPAVVGGVTRMEDHLAAAGVTTEIGLRWLAMTSQRLRPIRSARPTVRLLSPEEGAAEQQQAGFASITADDDRTHVPGHDNEGGIMSLVDTMLQWGLWLSGGALLSVIMLLAKK